MYRGGVPGVYDDWSECQAQLDCFPGTIHKCFQSKSEAEASYLKFTLAGERKKNRLKNYFIIHFLLIVIVFL
jgi:viroplasmin and RNaseH domain-containing protein